MVILDQVTLLTIDCRDPEMACKALVYSSLGIKFADLVLFSSDDVECEDITFIKIDPISDLTAYSNFCMKKLNQYIKTDFVITVQTDGFITNPHLWMDEFLAYDYIGSPWPPEAPWCFRNRVGNGGFSLRSKRFIELTANIDVDFRHEDVLLTNTLFEYFTTNGCRYAPVEVAMKFSLEAKIPECRYDLRNCFGFHGKGDAFYHQGEGQQFKDNLKLLDGVKLPTSTFCHSDSASA